MKIALVLLGLMLPLSVLAEEEVIADEAAVADEEAATAAEPPHPVDERIREQLDALELHYDVDDRNNFLLVFDFDDGRSQLVTIRSRTWVSHDLEMRDIWSIAYQHRTKFLPEYLERRLLLESYDHVIGGWARRDNDVVYVAKLPADTAAANLRAALYEVSEVADELELELLGTDEL